MKKVVAIFLVISFCLAMSACAALKEDKYQKAVELKSAAKYEEAWPLFQELGDYKDSQELYKGCRYMYAWLLFNKGDYEAAAPIFQELGDYDDAADYYGQIVDPVSAFIDELGSKYKITVENAQNSVCEIQAVGDGFSVKETTWSGGYSSFRVSFQCVWSNSSQSWSFTVNGYSDKGSVIGEGVISRAGLINWTSSTGSASETDAQKMVSQEYRICIDALEEAYNDCDMKVNYKWFYDALTSY